MEVPATSFTTEESGKTQRKPTRAVKEAAGTDSGCFRSRLLILAESEAELPREIRAMPTEEEGVGTLTS